MLKISILVFTALCVIYVNASAGRRLKRGYNNSGGGYKGDREGGYFNQGSSSNERDASVSRESGDHHQDSNSEERNDSREHTYGRDGYGQDDRYYGGKRPRQAN